MIAQIFPPDGGGPVEKPGLLSLTPATTVDLGKIAIGAAGLVEFQVQNIGTGYATITGISTSNPDWGFSSLPSIPLTLDPGAFATFFLGFTPLVAGVSTTTVTVDWTNIYGAGTPLTDDVTATAVLLGTVIWDPASLTFSTLEVNKTSQLTVDLKNSGALDANITALTFADGTQFSLVSPPALPFPLVAGASQTLTIQFNPTFVGDLTDTLTSTDDLGDNPVLAIQGLCLPLLPIAICVNNDTELIVGGYDSTGLAGKPAPLVSSPDNYNADQAGLIVFNGPIWQGLGVEKTLMRLGFYYENLGVATLSGTISCFRPQQGADAIDSKSFSISFGTVAADKSDRYVEVDAIASGEILVLTLTRAVSSGPVSLTLITPYFEARGEKVKDV